MSLSSSFRISAKPYLVALCALTLCLLLNGCNDNKEPKSEEILTISHSNKLKFIKQISDDYFNHFNKLIYTFNAAYQQDNTMSFIDYRNKTWTPNYFKDKQHYAAIFTKNEHYLENQTITPLFDLFNNLIYIGLELKHGLLNNDKKQLQQALITAKTNKNKMNAILVSVGLTPHE